MISVVTLYSTICVQDHWGIQIIASYGTYSCVSLWQSLCIFNHTFGILLNLSLFQDEPCYVSWWEFYWCIFCHTTCTLFVNTYCQYAYIKIKVSSKCFIAHTHFMFNCLVHHFTFCETSRTLYPLFQSILSVQYFVQFCANCVQTLRFPRAFCWLLYPRCNPR